MDKKDLYRKTFSTVKTSLLKLTVGSLPQKDKLAHSCIYL